MELKNANFFRGVDFVYVRFYKQSNDIPRSWRITPGANYSALIKSVNSYTISVVFYDDSDQIIETLIPYAEMDNTVKVIIPHTIKKFETICDEHTLTEEDFKAASEMCDIYQGCKELVDSTQRYAEAQSKMVDKIILDAFTVHLGCKSVEDVYEIITSESKFGWLNAYIHLINDSIQSNIDPIGTSLSYFQVSPISKPFERSDTLLEKLRECWKTIYGEGDNT